MNRNRVWQWADLTLILCVWGVVIFTLVKVTPIFASVVNDFGGTLPWPTRLVIQMSHFMESWWIPVVCIGAAGLGCFQFWRVHRQPTEGVQPAPRWERIAVTMLIALGALTFAFILAGFHMFWFGIAHVVSGT